jgi:hypothetical protein
MIERCRENSLAEQWACRWKAIFGLICPVEGSPLIRPQKEWAAIFQKLLNA